MYNIGSCKSGIGVYRASIVGFAGDLILSMLEVSICIERKRGQLAQRLERRFHIPKVTGSNPVLPSVVFLSNRV